jgi:hypothetical protein
MNTAAILLHPQDALINVLPTRKPGFDWWKEWVHKVLVISITSTVFRQEVSRYGGWLVRIERTDRSEALATNGPSNFDIGQWISILTLTFTMKIPTILFSLAVVFCMVFNTVDLVSQLSPCTGCSPLGQCPENALGRNVNSNWLSATASGSAKQWVTRREPQPG